MKANETTAQNPSAFPREGQAGMSLRDYFAAKALQGILSAEAHPQAGGFPSPGETVELSAETFATSAYAIADAMLKARSAD